PWTRSPMIVGWMMSAGQCHATSRASWEGWQSPSTGTVYASETACWRGSWYGVIPGVGKYSATVNGTSEVGILGSAMEPRSLSMCRAIASRSSSWYITRPETRARWIEPYRGERRRVEIRVITPSVMTRTGTMSTYKNGSRWRSTVSSSWENQPPTSSGRVSLTLYLYREERRYVISTPDRRVPRVACGWRGRGG